MIASNDKIAVAACHLDEGRRVIDLLRKCIASGERTPLATLQPGDQYPGIHDMALLRLLVVA
jgi:hypothetical protein